MEVVQFDDVFRSMVGGQQCCLFCCWFFGFFLGIYVIWFFISGFGFSIFVFFARGYIEDWYYDFGFLLFQFVWFLVW